MPNVSRIALARQLHRFAFALSVWLLISSRISHIFAAPSTEHFQTSDDDDADDGASREAVDDDGRFESFKNDDKFSNASVDGGDDDERRTRDSVGEHERPKNALPTRLKIVGDLATPAPESGVRLGFVPKQTYVQVRRYDEEVHLPRSAAYADAETQEELLNAPRLREVVSQKKTQEVSE